MSDTNEIKEVMPDPNPQVEDGQNDIDSNIDPSDELVVGTNDAPEEAPDDTESPPEAVNKPPTKKQLAADKAQAKLDAMVPEGTMVTCDDGEERPVIYRDTAIDNEVNRYFTGELCRNGHMAERKVKGYVCTICARLRQKARHKERMASDPDYKSKFAKKRADKHKKRYADDPEYRQRVLDRAKLRRTNASAVKAEEKSKLKEAEEQVVAEAEAA